MNHLGLGGGGGTYFSCETLFYERLPYKEFTFIVKTLIF